MDGVKTRVLRTVGCFICGLIAGSISASAESVSIEAQVSAVDAATRRLQVEIVKSEGEVVELSVGSVVDFKVGPGDAAIGYLGQTVQAEAVYYNKNWNLEQVFPVGPLDERAAINSKLRSDTKALRRGTYVKAGMPIPDFVLIDQNGAFVQASDLKGKAFVLNFIFTRCRATTMCPASTTRMAELQEQARAAGNEDLHFVTISFDPEYDSPGILRQYAEGYGIEFENFHLLTGSPQVVDDLLRQFGILTREEDGTINHTMATVLVDAEGIVAYRKEGQNWKVEDFMKAADSL